MQVAYPYCQPQGKVLILLSSPTKDENESNTPLRGETGLALAKLFQSADFDISQATVVYCYDKPISPFAKADGYHPVFCKKTSSNAIEINGHYVKDFFPTNREVIATVVEKLKPDVIIAFGDIASFLVSENPSSDKMRGSMLLFSGVKTVISRDPRLLLVTPEVLHPMRADIHRALNWGLRNDPPELTPNWSITIEPSFSETIRYLAEMQKQVEAAPTLIAVDIETVSTLISCIGFALSPTHAFCIPFIRETEANNPSYFTPNQELHIVQRLRAILTHKNALCIGQNFNYDNQYLARNWGFLANTHCDTMLAYHTCFSADSPKSLDYLASLFATHYYYWKDESRHRGKGVSDRQHWEYNAKDCIYTYELYEPLMRFVDSFNLREQYEFQMRMAHHAMRPMLGGIKWDKKLQMEMGMDVAFQLGLLQQQLLTIIPESIMPRKKNDKPYFQSPQKMNRLLYDIMGLPVQKNKKTKRPSSDDASLKELMKVDPLLKPWLRMILDYRSLSVFMNNYLKARVDHDGRMRTSYNVAGTSTYRFASSKDSFGFGLNLQNISAGK